MRSKVEAEIMSTEASYLANLQFFVSEFIEPLRLRAHMARSGARKDESLGVDDEAMLRLSCGGNLENIAHFHGLFYAELVKAYESAGAGAGGPGSPTPRSITGAPRHPNLAHVFLQFADFFKLYTAYLESYEACVRQLDDLKAHERFQRFVRDEFMRKPRRTAPHAPSHTQGTASRKGADQHISAPSPVSHQTAHSIAQSLAVLTMQPHAATLAGGQPGQSPQSQQSQTQSQALSPCDYYIQPVQRLPRYVLLLKELLRHVPATDLAHHGPLTHALAKLEGIAAFVNERQRTVENMSLLLLVSQGITGTASLPGDVHLIEPHRRLLRQGFVALLRERSLLGTVKVSRVQLFLFNDLIIYTNDVGRFKGALDLATIDVDSQPQGGSAITAVLAADGEPAGVTSSSASAAAAASSMFRLSDSNTTLLVKCSSPDETRSWSSLIASTSALYQAERDTVRRRQRVLKARSRATRGADQYRRDMHALIRENLSTLPGATDSAAAQAAADIASGMREDPAELAKMLSPTGSDPQRDQHWLEQEASRAAERSKPLQRHGSSTSSNSSGSSGSISLGGGIDDGNNIGGSSSKRSSGISGGGGSGMLLPREVIEQLKLKSASSSACASLSASSVNSTCSTVANSANSSRQASRRPSFSATATGQAGHWSSGSAAPDALLYDKERNSLSASYSAASSAASTAPHKLSVTDERSEQNNV